MWPSAHHPATFHEAVRPSRRAMIVVLCAVLCAMPASAGAATAGTAQTPTRDAAITAALVRAPGDIGFWRAWRNHYDRSEIEAILDYAKTYIHYDMLGTGTPLTVDVMDAVLRFGRHSTRDQKLLARSIVIALDVAETYMDWEGTLVQTNGPLCMNDIVDISSIPGADRLHWDTTTPSINAVLYAHALYWAGRFTPDPNDWTFGYKTPQDREAAYQVAAGIASGSLPITRHCPD
jgi:hypothetical protein